MPWVYVDCAIYEIIWCNGFAEIYAQLGGVGGKSARYMCILLYIYRSAMRCGKFGVLVCKASMLNWRRGWGSISYRYMCILLYIYHRHGKGIEKEMMRFGAFIIIGDSGMDTGRFADESWQFQCACTVVFPPEEWSR